MFQLKCVQPLLLYESESDSPFSALMNHIFEKEFPHLAKRYRACAEALGTTPLYGLFYSFCLNAARPEDGVGRVHCSPHIDWKNLAIGICVIFVYGIHLLQRLLLPLLKLL